MITLVCSNQRYECSLQEAEAILAIQDKMKATKWELPSQYQRQKDGTIKRRNQEINRGAATKERDRKRDISPE